MSTASIPLAYLRLPIFKNSAELHQIRLDLVVDLDDNYCMETQKVTITDFPVAVLAKLQRIARDDGVHSSPPSVVRFAAVQFAKGLPDIEPIAADPDGHRSDSKTKVSVKTGTEGGQC